MARVIVIDDNTAVHNGHYNELSSLLLSAAAGAGYLPTLVAHRDYRDNASLPANCDVRRIFTTRRMTRWSCGFDGQSSIARNMHAAPITQTFRNRCQASKDEWLTRAQWRPTEMLRRWSTGLLQAIELLQPTGEDELIFQTADDFMMVAMARALASYRSTRLRLNAIFHYAVHGSDDPQGICRAAFDQQLNYACEQLSFHDLKLLATTEPLAEQMNAGSLRYKVDPIPYPIRVPKQIKSRNNNVPRIVLGGVHRVEQGRDAVAPFLASVHQQFLHTNQFSLSLRLDPKHWQRIVPPTLHASYEPAIRRQARLIADGEDHHDAPLPVLDVQPATLSEPGYYAMLTSGDLGVLLYDASRYQVRCSGILLEFLTRGIPVIAPDHCWLGTIVKKYSGSHPIGYVYRDSQEIPNLLLSFLKNRKVMQRAALQAAPVISNAHAPQTTLAHILRNRNSKLVAA